MRPASALCHICRGGEESRSGWAPGGLRGPSRRYRKGASVAQREEAVGGAQSATRVDGQEYQRLKPNAVGLVGVVFMAVATAAPITAMTGNVPVAVGYVAMAR